jgi:predicted metalloprotease with PDZ domain
MRKIFLLGLLILSICSFAQKTIIIQKSEDVTKSIDGDGKMIKITKTIEEGEMADLPNMDKDGEYLTVEKNINKGKEESMYKLTKVKDGKKEVIIWDGQGEMPAAIKDKMKNVNISTKTDGKMMKMVTIDASEEEDNKGRGKRNNADRKERRKMDNRWESRSSNDNKLQLGIMLNDNGEGAEVDEVFKGSVADKAGINKGDIILKINGEYVFSTNHLIRKIGGLKSGDKMDLVVLRDKKEVSLKGQF